jgi:hypothetical protein
LVIVAKLWRSVNLKQAPRTMSEPVILIQVRHSAKCPHRDDPDYVVWHYHGKR